MASAALDKKKSGLTTKAFKNVVEGAILMGEGLALAFVAKLFLFSMVIGGIVVVGVGGVVVRWLFFWMLPTLIQFSVPLTLLVDFFSSVFTIFVDAAIAVIDAIIGIIDFLTGHATNNMIHFIGFKLFTVDEVRDFLVYCLDTCEPYNNAWAVIGRSIKQAAQIPVCAAVRYTYPVGWLYSASEGILDWLYLGSAEPLVSLAEIRDGVNCQVIEPTGSVSAVCVGIGFGCASSPS